MDNMKVCPFFTYSAPYIPACAGIPRARAENKNYG